MPARRRGGNRQPELFARSKQPTIALPDNHPMVVLTNTVDWTELELETEKVRRKKLKNAAGRPPHLRATLGALTLMAIRRMPYREAEEQIRYYAPARYLCGLTETDWTPDFTTIQDFAQLLGEDGCRLINEAVVKQAVALGLADPTLAVADMTAQEAAIPHPNEMGLSRMSGHRQDHVDDHDYPSLLSQASSFALESGPRLGAPRLRYACRGITV